MMYKIIEVFIKYLCQHKRTVWRTLMWLICQFLVVIFSLCSIWKMGTVESLWQRKKMCTSSSRMSYGLLDLWDKSSPTDHGPKMVLYSQAFFSYIKISMRNSKKKHAVSSKVAQCCGKMNAKQLFPPTISHPIFAPTSHFVHPEMHMYDGEKCVAACTMLICLTFLALSFIT